MVGDALVCRRPCQQTHSPGGALALTCLPESLLATTGLLQNSSCAALLTSLSSASADARRRLIMAAPRVSCKVTLRRLGNFCSRNAAVVLMVAKGCCGGGGAGVQVPPVRCQQRGTFAASLSAVAVSRLQPFPGRCVAALAPS